MLKDTPEFGNRNAVICRNMTVASFIFGRIICSQHEFAVEEVSA
jgi:hypothetical protein